MRRFGRGILERHDPVTPAERVWITAEVEETKK
jgi:hypothetical protein